MPEWQSVALDALVAASGGGDTVSSCSDLAAAIASAGTHGLGPHPLVRVQMRGAEPQRCPCADLRLTHTTSVYVLSWPLSPSSCRH